LAVFGAIYASNAASFDGARWRVARAASRIVGDPNRVGGSFDWTGYQRRIHPNGREPVCVLLEARAERPKGHDALRAEGVWGPTGTQFWVVADKTEPC
jgi:hypothetical protein